MRRLFSFFVALWVASVVALISAADLNCKGLVVDSEGEPIIGASLSITGGKAVGTTDIDGKFNVRVPESTKSLTITYVGYHPE